MSATVYIGAHEGGEVGYVHQLNFENPSKTIQYQRVDHQGRGLLIIIKKMGLLKTGPHDRVRVLCPTSAMRRIYAMGIGKK